jgi:hypothetical protein
MSIKQNGGVFGRNPTFNDVTIDGTLIFNGDIDVNSDLKVNGDLDVTGEGLFDGNVGINTDSPSSPSGKCLTVYDTSFPRINLKNSTTGDGATDGMEFYLNGANAYILNREAGSIGFGTGNAVHMTLNTTGNLAFGSGKGIDFSATAGTGTSELLDDYEEGTWTPTILGTTSGSATVVVNASAYTKVGSLVVASAYITVDLIGDTVVGDVVIGGLPFANATNNLQGVSVTYQSLSTTFPVLSGRVTNSQIRLMQNTVKVGLGRTDCTSSSGRTLQVSVTYHA